MKLRRPFFAYPLAAAGPCRRDPGIRFLGLPVVVALAWALTVGSGCTGRYFSDAGPTTAVPPTTLAKWPAREYWSGIVFNGKKIGFSHLQITSDPDQPGTFVIHSEAYFHLRFLMVDKSMRMRAVDRVDPNLGLIRGRYDSEIDGNSMQIEYRHGDGRLHYVVHNRGEATGRSLALEGARPIYPASAIGLYPRLQGLEVGRSHHYRVFDPRSQSLETVVQNITALERSDLFEGPAFRIRSRYQGQSMTTWMDSRGRPLLEMSMGGALIAALEDERQARRYLTRAALSKDEALLNFSLIPAAGMPADADRLDFLALVVQGLPSNWAIPSDRRQQCLRRGHEILCGITRLETAADKTETGDPDDLRPTAAINAHHPRIEQAARHAVDGILEDRARIAALFGWLQRHITPEPVDGFSSLDVLDEGRADCQGHTLLFAAMARTLGIPTRVVNGIVYSSRHRGFLYHSWNECRIGNRWLAVDPTWGQIPADATHLKLVEGHRLEELAPLMEIIGKLSVRIESAH